MHASHRSVSQSVSGSRGFRVPLRNGGTAIRVVRDAKCFEGMKAYRDNDGHIRMFRPRENVLRMNSSIERLCLPVGCGCRRLSVARGSGCAPGGHQGVGARG